MRDNLLAQYGCATVSIFLLLVVIFVLNELVPRLVEAVTVLQ